MVQATEPFSRACRWAGSQERLAAAERGWVSGPRSLSIFSACRSSRQGAMLQRAGEGNAKQIRTSPRLLRRTLSDSSVAPCGGSIPHPRRSLRTRGRQTIPLCRIPCATPSTGMTPISSTPREAPCFRPVGGTRVTVIEHWKLEIPLFCCCSSPPLLLYYVTSRALSRVDRQRHRPGAVAGTKGVVENAKESYPR